MAEITKDQLLMLKGVAVKYGGFEGEVENIEDDGGVVVRTTGTDGQPLRKVVPVQEFLTNFQTHKGVPVGSVIQQALEAKKKIPQESGSQPGQMPVPVGVLSVMSSALADLVDKWKNQILGQNNVSKNKGPRAGFGVPLTDARYNDWRQLKCASLEQEMFGCLENVRSLHARVSSHPQVGHILNRLEMADRLMSGGPSSSKYEDGKRVRLEAMSEFQSAFISSMGNEKTPSETVQARQDLKEMSVCMQNLTLLSRDIERMHNEFGYSPNPLINGQVRDLNALLSSDSVSSLADEIAQGTSEIELKGLSERAEELAMFISDMFKRILGVGHGAERDDGPSMA